MVTTPNANRKHIAFFGNTNAGKSALLNAIVGQEISIVSPVHGTTTDPVMKAMELLPFGPVLFIDTAGLNDSSELGEVRIKRSRKIFQRTDFAIYVLDATNINLDSYQATVSDFKRWRIPYLTVVNKTDLLETGRIGNQDREGNGVKQENKVKEKLKTLIPDAIFVSAENNENILELKDILIEKLSGTEKDETILGDLLPRNSNVIMVIPIDSEAPKGRIILTQVQLIRDCLDNGIKSFVVQDTELEDALKELKKVDLVVTDSQAFKFVSGIVPPEIMLTSFSILFARVKGDIDAFVEGVKQVENLVDGSKVLIAESCTHNHSHEDIGRVKIPRLLTAYTNKKLEFEFKMGHDFPESLDEYDLVIHCGSCMLNKKVMNSRIDLCDEANVKITNYGIILAYLNGILDRSIEIFKNNL